MTAPAPALLARSWRGSAAETVVRGHVAVVSAEGEVTSALGDPEALVTLRSCVKPVQALPFVVRAMDRIGAGSAHLAVACASHNGEPEHVRAVDSLLALAGLGRDALRCGPQLPFDEESTRAVLVAGGPPQRVHNNCSGKHAAMLATCVVEGWDASGYLDRTHPCQEAVSAELGRRLGVDLADAPWGVDGCGLPTFGVPLRVLARAFAAAAEEPPLRRCQDAMAEHPHLVAGRGRFDTAILEAAGDRITAKGGGAAVWVAALRETGGAVAMKLEAGEASAMPAVAIAVLTRLGALAAPLPPGLTSFEAPALRNWEGTRVGEIRAEAETIADLATGPL